MAQETFQFFTDRKDVGQGSVREKLAEIGKTNDRIVVLTADLMRSNKTGDFMKAHPDRFFNIGIAEQNMMGIATGLALDGKLPLFPPWPHLLQCGPVNRYGQISAMPTCR